jgi:hypothetical protein
VTQSYVSLRVPIDRGCAMLLADYGGIRLQADVMM